MLRSTTFEGLYFQSYGFYLSCFSIIFKILTLLIYTSNMQGMFSKLNETIPIENIDVC